MLDGPIRCDQDQLAVAMSHFPCQVTYFPLKYLGIPLSIGKLPKTVLQPIVDQMADRVPTWKGGLMHRSGRLTLIKSTLAAMPVYTSIAMRLSKWLTNSMQKIMRSFLWSGTEVV
jgi:hypothetical protein